MIEPPPPKILKYLSLFTGCFDIKHNSNQVTSTLNIFMFMVKYTTHTISTVSYSFSFISHTKKKREKRLIELKFETNLRGLVSYSLSFL